MWCDVTLQTAIEAELPFLRAEAESRMTDTCRITTPGAAGSGEINPITLGRDAPTPTTVYEGACRLGREPAPTASTAVGGEAAWTTHDVVLHLPLGSSTAAVAVDNTVTYLTSTANPRLVGRTFGIVAIVEGTDLTALRCRVREVVGV